MFFKDINTFYLYNYQGHKVFLPFCRFNQPIIRNILLQQYDSKRNTLPNEKRKKLLKEELDKLESIEND